VTGVQTCALPICLKPHRNHPYLLKEYRNRWYLIAWEAEKSDYRTYALDRMKALQVKKKTFETHSDFNSDRFFEHSIGITEIDSEPVRIVLNCNQVRGKYLESQPIHSSQRIVWIEDGNAEVTLNVLITYELIAELLSYGPSTRVVEPLQLRDRLQATLEENLAQYL